MPSVADFMFRGKLGRGGKVYMIDQTCGECERLWDAYEQVIQSQRIIEGRSGMETGLVRKASNRREEARMALEDHETTHMTVTVTTGSLA